MQAWLSVNCTTGGSTVGNAVMKVASKHFAQKIIKSQFTDGLVVAYTAHEAVFDSSYLVDGMLEYRFCKTTGRGFFLRGRPPVFCPKQMLTGTCPQRTLPRGYSRIL